MISKQKSMNIFDDVACLWGAGGGLEQMEIVHMILSCLSWRTEPSGRTFPKGQKMQTYAHVKILG